MTLLLLFRRYMLWPKKEKEAEKNKFRPTRVTMARCPRLCSAEPPRKMRRKATAMWSRSSSSSDDVNDEAEGTERREFQKRKKARGP